MKEKATLLDAIEDSVGSYVIIGLKGSQPVGGAKLAKVLDDGIILRGDDGGKVYISQEIIAFVHDTGAIKVVQQVPKPGPQGLVTQ